MSSTLSRGDDGAVLELPWYDDGIGGDSIDVCFTFTEEVRLGSWTMTTRCCAFAFGLGEDNTVEAVRDR